MASDVVNVLFWFEHFRAPRPPHPLGADCLTKSNLVGGTEFRDRTKARPIQGPNGEGQAVTQWRRPQMGPNGGGHKWDPMISVQEHCIGESSRDRREKYRLFAPSKKIETICTMCGSTHSNVTLFRPVVLKTHRSRKRVKWVVWD